MNPVYIRIECVDSYARLENIFHTEVWLFSKQNFYFLHEMINQIERKVIRGNYVYF